MKQGGPQLRVTEFRETGCHLLENEQAKFRCFRSVLISMKALFRSSIRLSCWNIANMSRRWLGIFAGEWQLSKERISSSSSRGSTSGLSCHYLPRAQAKNCMDC